MTGEESSCQTLDKCNALSVSVPDILNFRKSNHALENILRWSARGGGEGEQWQQHRRRRATAQQQQQQQQQQQAAAAAAAAAVSEHRYVCGCGG
jgi:transcription initiation factor TFIID subunit TAF12